MLCQFTMSFFKNILLSTNVFWCQQMCNQRLFQIQSISNPPPTPLPGIYPLCCINTLGTLIPWDAFIKLKSGPPDKHPFHHHPHEHPPKWNLLGLDAS